MLSEKSQKCKLIEGPTDAFVLLCIMQKACFS